MSSQRLGQLRLYRIIAVSSDGRPVLDGTNARVLAAGVASADDIHKMAVCQDIEEAGEHMIVVLGVLADKAQTLSDERPLVISHGEASLTLHHDGRIRMTGSDIGLDAQCGFNVSAGRIDLN